jgi:transketolase
MSINLKAGIIGVLRRSRREINQSNQEQGRSGEAQVKARYEMNGWKVTRTGKGHDYRVTRKNWTTGKTETKYVEVKTGNSQLSPLQRKKKKQFGSKYVEERVGSNPLMGYGRTICCYTPNYSPQKEKKKSKSSNTSIFDVLFGTSKSSKKSRTKSKKSKSRSNLDILFGTSKSSRKSKSRGRSNVDKIWGSSSGSRSRSRGRSNVDKIWGSSSGSTSIW